MVGREPMTALEHDFGERDDGHDSKAGQRRAFDEGPGSRRPGLGATDNARVHRCGPARELTVQHVQEDRPQRVGARRDWGDVLIDVRQVVHVYDPFDVDGAIGPSGRHVVETLTDDQTLEYRTRALFMVRSPQRRIREQFGLTVPVTGDEREHDPFGADGRPTRHAFADDVQSSAHQDRRNRVNGHAIHTVRISETSDDLTPHRKPN